MVSEANYIIPVNYDSKNIYIKNVLNKNLFYEIFNGCNFNILEFVDISKVPLFGKCNVF